MGFDKDRDENAFNFYKMMYTDLPWALFDFDHLDNDNKGYFVTLKTKSELEVAGYEDLTKYTDLVEQYGGILRLSGDADFGMKCKSTFNNNQEAYKCACKLIENPDEIMHSNCNFSLMAMNGGMNSNKGFRRYRDIFPRFLYAISQYYEIKEMDKKTEFVQNNLGTWNTAGGRPKKDISKETRNAEQEKKYKSYIEQDIPALICFLDTFDDIDDYCVKTFFWGKNSPDIKKLLKDIKKFGAKVDYTSINQNVNEYCELAKRYWQERNKIIEETNKKNK
ncbi:MAG: hypothetical protein IK078_03280 [Lachnospiraceae bacterium]|nr:hypothetical protein [Lachnospiraceae bacterium]